MKRTIIIVIFFVAYTPTLQAQTEMPPTETAAHVHKALHKADRYYQHGKHYKAFPIYRRYSESPLFTAKEAIRLGDLYEARDENVTKDFAHAAHCYQIAAEKGDAEGQYLLGAMYLDGQGIAPNSDSALYWLDKAAAQNNADAEWMLGDIYENGRGGIAKDLEKAKIWYRRAAKDGEIEAWKDCQRLGIKW